MNCAFKIFSISFCLLSLIFFFSACSDDDTPAVETNATDQEGNSFKTVKIGDQIWSAENLNVGTYRTGDQIFQVKTQEDWDFMVENGIPAWCYYDYDPSNASKYGRLYNWHAVNQTHGLAPNGWHIPTDAEWTTLINTLGGEAVAGFKMKSVEWTGDNSSGFNAIPAGHAAAGAFDSINEDATWWSATPQLTNAWLRSLSPGHNVVRSNYPQVGCFSIRLIKD